MSKFNIFLLFFITGLSGCIAPSNKGDGSNATFIVQQVKGILSISTETALPEKFTLKLETCLHFRKKIDTKLPNTEWAISHTREGVRTPRDKIPKSNNLVMGDEQNKVIKVTADGNGCIEWTEEYDYAHSRESRWIVINRYIRALTRPNGGEATIPLAVNPWLQLKDKYSNIQVADYRDDYDKNDPILKGRLEEDGLKFLAQKKKEEQKNKVDVVINKLELRWDGSESKSDAESGESKTVFTDTIISAKLEYSIKDINGQLQDNIMAQGDFQIESHLLMSISEDNKKKYMKINENGAGTLIKTRFPSGRLTSLRFDWIVPYISTNENTSFRLYIKVIPIGNTAKRVNSFEGLYYIANNFSDTVTGNIKTLNLMEVLGQKYRERVTDGPLNSPSPSVFHDQDLYDLNGCLTKLHYGVDSILQSCISQESPDAQTDGVRSAGWAVTDMAIRFFGMEKENWLFRSIKTQVKTSVVDQRNTPISASYITIRVTDLSTGEVQVYGEKGDYPIRTENDGAISFNIYTKQKWYNRQRYFLKIIQVETRESTDLKITKMVAINPWDYGFTHGFEVNHPDKTRATCLKGTEDKALLDLFSMDKNQIVSIIKQESENSVKYNNAIRSLFCADRYKESEEALDDGTLKKVLSIGEIFHKFRETLIKVSSLSRDSLKRNFIDYLKRGFTSSTSEEVKKPIVQIHLFRSVNKYPTYLIDSSLKRELYYNIRVKLTPRVVRHDDIARGQQNKGPLRDGVYIFQMAVLKNDQGKFHGRKAMVSSLEDFWDIKGGRSSNKAGTLGLYDNCFINAANCIIAEDFIVPPTNIPVIIRDGMMKTDVHTHIRREHLLFANSKTLMVFRLLPADPASITCKDGSKTCTMKSSRVGESYEDAFDWSKDAIKKIKAADLDDYDMFIYTYKVPFIPSLWTNWTITHELDISFDDLVKQYNLLSAFEAFDEESNGLSNMMEYSREKYAEQTSKGEFVLPHGQYLEKLVQWQNTVRQIQDNIKQQIDRDHGKSAGLENELKPVLDQMKEELEKHRKRVTEDRAFTAEQQAHILERLKETESEINDLSFIKGVSFIKEDSDGIGDIEEPLLAERTAPVTTTPYYLPIYDPREEKDRSCVEADFQKGNEKAEKAICLNEEKSTEDLLQRHQAHFASVNNLCTINLDSRRTDSSCGSFSSGEDLQTDFINSLNMQIQSFNRVRSAVIEETKTPLSKVIDLVRSPEPVSDSPTAIKDSFEKVNYYNSVGFTYKIKNMPPLQTLDKGDLKEIIELEDISENVNNEKTGAFIYALCGFWFDKFLSNEYINEDLFLNGLRQAVKRTYYYQLNKIYHQKDGNKDIFTNTINTASKGGPAGDLHEFKESVLASLKESYEKNLKAVRDRGAIDDLYKWVDSKAVENYGFDAAVVQKWRDQLQGTSLGNLLVDRNPLVHHRPSWIKPDDYVPGFNIENYLSEARAATKRGNSTILSPTDYHPVRKCINNPTHFFGFEKKTIVGKLDENLYGDDTGAGGESITLNISKAFLMNTQRDQGANQGFNLGVGGNLSLVALPLLALLIPGLGVGVAAKAAITAVATIFGLNLLTGNTGYDYRMYEGTGKRRWLSIQVIETADLIAEHTPISMTLTDYHQCLVIRPRFSAFAPYEDDFPTSRNINFQHIWKGKNYFLRSIYERMGILLCTPGTKDKPIKEDYYYIYPSYPVNGITMDTSSHRNKPFAISLRGRNAFEKFLSTVSCDVSETKEPFKESEQPNCRNTRGKYENLFLKNIEFADNLRDGFNRTKLFHLTGDSPGVYSLYVEPEDRDIHSDKRWYHKWANVLSDWERMDADLEKWVREEPE
ncbi:MAG: hypothetical protein OXM55_04590 [Bdellovibrionales bacterium]|nr:hypothetical protein [Bdellovibrionales bacterium]